MLCQAPERWWMPSQIPLISITATLALPLSPSLSGTCHPSACLIYKVVMAIHSNVISCHINTYISGRYYKACNGGESGVLWGSFFRIFGRMLLVALREKLALALILKVQDKRPRRLFYYHQTGFLLQPLHVPFVSMTFQSKNCSLSVFLTLSELQCFSFTGVKCCFLISCILSERRQRWDGVK